MESKLVKRVGAWSVFKFIFVLSLIVFLIFYVLMVVGYLITLGTGMLEVNEQVQQWVQGLGVGGAIMLVFLFFGGLFWCLMQAVQGAIGATIYNLIAMMTGGIEVRVEERQT